MRKTKFKSWDSVLEGGFAGHVEVGRRRDVEVVECTEEGNGRDSDEDSSSVH